MGILRLRLNENLDSLRSMSNLLLLAEKPGRGFQVL